MKKYEVEIDDATSNFFEEIAIFVQRPIEEILSDTLYKQVEIISRNISKHTALKDETLS